MALRLAVELIVISPGERPRHAEFAEPGDGLLLILRAAAFMVFVPEIAGHANHIRLVQVDHSLPIADGPPVAVRNFGAFLEEVRIGNLKNAEAGGIGNFQRRGRLGIGGRIGEAGKGGFLFRSECG